MPGPLDGYRIIDTTSMISGPLGAMLLGDQGADVIKIEVPGTGDLVRFLGAKRNGTSATFLTANRNKRSVALNLKEKKGLEILKKMVLEADVFLQNFRPGVADRMGIGEETLRTINPRLIYVSISGFGEQGPYSNKRVYDPIIQALSGLADIQRDRESNRPHMVRLIVPDNLTAMTSAQAITAALLARERTGKGQHVRLSMIDAMISFLWTEGMAGYTFRGEGVDGERVTLSQDLVFETTDGYISTGAVSDSEWQGLVRALEKPEWLNDPRFQTPSNRMANAEARLALMAKVIEENTSRYWLDRLEAESVPCAPVLRRREVFKHPQVVANGLIEESEHPVAGPIRQTRPAARFSETPTEFRRHAPGVGEHTREVLQELGLTALELEELKEKEIIG